MKRCCKITNPRKKLLSSIAPDRTGSALSAICRRAAFHLRWQKPEDVDSQGLVTDTTTSVARHLDNVIRELRALLRDD
jgi:hypothetical protein